MRRGWQVALSAVFSLLIVGVALFAVSGCTRSCSHIEWPRALEALSRRVEEMERGAGSAPPSAALPTLRPGAAQAQRDVPLRR